MSKHIEILPSGRVLSVTVQEPVNTPDYPLLLECDFCCTKTDRVWMYPTYAFGVQTGFGLIDSPEGGWGACVYCRALFEQQRFDLLAARVYTLMPAIGPGIDRLHSAAYDARKGPVRVWHQGEPYRE